MLLLFILAVINEAVLREQHPADTVSNIDVIFTACHTFSLFPFYSTFS